MKDHFINWVLPAFGAVATFAILFWVMEEPENPPHDHQWAPIEHFTGPITYYCRVCGELRNVKP